MRESGSCIKYEVTDFKIRCHINVMWAVSPSPEHSQGGFIYDLESTGLKFF
jgi:hypothetical protein